MITTLNLYKALSHHTFTTTLFYFILQRCSEMYSKVLLSFFLIDHENQRLGQGYESLTARLGLLFLQGPCLYSH